MDHKHKKITKTKRKKSLKEQKQDKIQKYIDDNLVNSTKEINSNLSDKEIINIANLLNLSLNSKTITDTSDSVSLLSFYDTNYLIEDFSFDGNIRETSDLLITGSMLINTDYFVN